VSQKQVKKPTPKEKVEKTEDKPVDKEKAEKLKADTDKLLDEIDDILEKDSEEFINSYVQRGGE